MNDSDGLPSKASTSSFGFMVNRFELHWHTICIDLLHYMKSGRHFVSACLLRLWLRFGLRGTRTWLGLRLYIVDYATCSLMSALVCLRYFFGGVVVGARPTGSLLWRVRVFWFLPLSRCRAT